MKNSYKYQETITIDNLSKTLQYDNNYCYSINFAILFEKKRDCQKFLKEVKKNNFNFSSRNANLFRVVIANCKQEVALDQANKFLKFAKENEFVQLINFVY